MILKYGKNILCLINQLKKKHDLNNDHIVSTNTIMLFNYF